MLSAPEAFMAVANATAAIVQKASPYVTYHVHGVVRAAGKSSLDRSVAVRGDDARYTTVEAAALDQRDDRLSR